MRDSCGMNMTGETPEDGVRGGSAHAHGKRAISRTSFSIHDNGNMPTSISESSLLQYCPFTKQLYYHSTVILLPFALLSYQQTTHKRRRGRQMFLNHLPFHLTQPVSPEFPVHYGSREQCRLSRFHPVW